MALALDRTTLLREPALITYNSGTFYAQGDIAVAPVLSRSSLRSSVHGVFDATRATDKMFRVSFTPVGEWENLSVLFGNLATTFGASIIGATDLPLVIHCLSGRKITFTNAALTKLPTIIGSVRRTILGPVEFTCVIENEGDPSSAAAYFAETSESYPGDAAFSSAGVLTAAMEAAWGSAPWDSFGARDGWVITPEMTLEPEFVDGIGTVDFKLVDARVMAVAQPVGPDLDDARSALGFGTALGASRVSGGQALNITATGFYVRLYNALITEVEQVHGQRPTLGNVTWMATRTWSTGTMQPLLYTGTSAPS